MKKILLLIVFVFNGVWADGGILPWTVKDNKLLFLLGKEVGGPDKGHWSDFGGAKNGSESYAETAVRECREETNGVINLSVNALIGSLLLYEHPEEKNGWGKGYGMYLVHVHYIDEGTFNRSGHGEKSDFKWVEGKSLKKVIEEGQEGSAYILVNDKWEKVRKPFWNTLKRNEAIFKALIHD